MLLGVQPARLQEFGFFAQARYAALEAPGTTPEEILVSLRNILKEHPELVSNAL